MAAVSRILPTLQYLNSYLRKENLLPASNEVSVEADGVVDKEVIPVVVSEEILDVDGEVLEEVDGVQHCVETSAPCVLVHLEGSCEAEDQTLGVIKVDQNAVDNVQSLSVSHGVEGLLKVLSDFGPVSGGLKGLETVAVGPVQPGLNLIEFVLGESAHSLCKVILSKI